MARTQSTINALPIVAQRLREARVRAGISQKNLGIAVGIDEFSASARVNQYERGKHTPDYSMVEKFAQTLDVPTEFFYARDERMAEALLLLHHLTERQKTQAISFMKKQGKAKKQKAPRTQTE